MGKNPISLGEAFTPATVKLGGQEFETQDLKRSTQKEFAEIQDKINELDDADTDAAVALFGEQLDLILRPVGKSPTKAPKPSALIKKAWEDEDVGSKELAEFVLSVYAEVSPF